MQASLKVFPNSRVAHHSRPLCVLCYWHFLFLILACAGVRAEATDLLQRYPTTLTAGDTNPDRARLWEFTGRDVFRVTQFHLEIGKELRVDVGLADLGIGHCADGAVWAVLIPRVRGIVASPATNREEAISHVWLRFHPKEINRLFPPQTVSDDGATNLVAQMRFIANFKQFSSWHAGGRMMIPEPKDMTVDIDTKDGPRRFFSVDTEAKTASYWAAFANRSVRQPSALTSELAKEAFDQIWQAFDQKYAMFVLRPEVNWATLRERYRPKALASQSTFQFAEVCADMLRNLRDLHIWLTLAGTYVPVFDRPRIANANLQAYQTILGDFKQEGRMGWAVTTNNIGFIAIHGWDDEKIPAQCGEALEHMRDTRGLIVDVRLNGGGDELMAEKFAGRFLEKEFVYARNQYRNGPAHTNLTEMFERKVAPSGPWRYDRPVLLLIGQKCMSSDESFVGMMTGDSKVTTLGDHTCGSSGNPEIINLPLDMTVSVPQWIDYLPDGTPVDERGFQPQIPFKPAPGAFEGTRDDLLTAALARLSQAQLPGKPIEGPVFDPGTAFLPNYTRGVEEEAKDTSRPKVISVTPTNGATEVGSVTELHVRFDQPMDPLSLKLDWDAGGFLDCEFPKYDSNTYEFTIPAHLAPGLVQQIVVNKPLRMDGNLAKERRDFPREGFQSVDHHLAGLFVWRFQTQALPVLSHSKPPQVTLLSPVSGTHTPIRTFLHVQFDQPMAPPEEAIPFLLSEPDAEDIRMVSRILYDTATRTFRIPLLLQPNKKVEFTLTGFRSAAGVPAQPIKLQYQVSNEELSQEEREKIDASVSDPSLLALLETMKEKRRQLASLAERVQTLFLMQRNGLFWELQSESSTFKWCKPDQFYCDVTGPILNCSDFRIGSDGQRWWWHDESDYATNFNVCPAKEINELNIALSDPFDLTRLTPALAASQRKLKFDGVSKSEASGCFQFEAWHTSRIFNEMAPYASLVQWWIDPETYRPAQITVFDVGGGVSRLRFLYDSVNEPLPAGDFAVPLVDRLEAVPPESLNADYTNRFINLSDGSDGNMKIRYGKQGPKGVVDGGFIMDGY
jgi:hypothetical protein